MEMEQTFDYRGENFECLLSSQSRKISIKMVIKGSKRVVVGYQPELCARIEGGAVRTNKTWNLATKVWKISLER